MPELPVVTGGQAIKAFEKAGFSVVRIKGSHHIMKAPDHVFLLTVPVHGNKPLKPGTLRALIRGADLSVEAFLELLD